MQINKEKQRKIKLLRKFIPCFNPVMVIYLKDKTLKFSSFIGHTKFSEGVIILAYMIFSNDHISYDLLYM